MTFPGYPPFIETAAHDLGVSPEVIREAKKQPALFAVAELVGQALASPLPSESFTAKPVLLRDALRVASLAAERMVALIELAPAPAPEFRKPVRVAK